MVILPLLLTPVVAVIQGYLVNLILVFILHNARPSVNNTPRHFQIVTILLLAMSNSANDTQKSMGVIAFGLVLAGQLPSFSIPLWVVAAYAFALALGATRGDWRQIRNLGSKMYRIRPMNALSSQLASSGLILAASALGMPVSTPHVISSAMLGTEASERIKKVHWQVASQMVINWTVTITATMVVTAVLFTALIGLVGLF